MRSRWLFPFLALLLASLAALELGLVRRDEPRRDVTGDVRDDALEVDASSAESVVLAPVDDGAREDEQGAREPLVRKAAPRPVREGSRLGLGTRRRTLESVSAILSGRVIDQHGVGVAQVDLRLTAGSSSGLRGSATSDEQGCFRIEAIPAAQYELDVEHDAFLPLHVKLEGMRDGEERLALVYRLDPGLSIAGVVRMPDGTPAEGARLRLVQAEARSTDRVVRARCESGGRFELRGLAAGRYVLHAELTAVPPLRDGETVRDAHFRRFRAVRARVDAGASDVELTLQHDFTLSGQVLDEQGKPVTSLGVRAYPASGFALELGDDATYREGFDDLEGRFTLDGLAPGGWRVVIRARNGRHAPPREFVVRVDRDVEGLVFRVPTSSPADE